MKFHLLLILVGLCSLVLANPGASAEPADSDQAFTDAETLLDALETADRDIKTFHAEIIYDRFFMLQDDRHIRGGDLYFRVDGVPAEGGRPFRTFAVHFEWLWLGGAKREERQAWMFDGEWLVEKRFADKQYVARQIAKPGQQIDPLRLGEGPLPIPIGQRKADIMARYTAEIRPENDGFDPDNANHSNYMNAVRGAVQLQLTPLPERAERDDFRSIRLWYRRDEGGRLLPVLSRTVDRKGDESFVLLANVRVNGPIPEDVIDIGVPPVEAGWDVQTERWRGEDEQDDGADDGSGAVPSAAANTDTDR